MIRDIAIIGGGPVGLAAAITLSRAGYSVSVLERAPHSAWAEPGFDGREIALTHHAVDVLDSLGAWDSIPTTAISPLREARVESGRNGPPLIFGTGGKPRSSHGGVVPKGTANDSLGWLVSNNLIRRALFHAAAEHPDIAFIGGAEVTALRHARDHVEVQHGGGAVSARLVIAADGRFSPTRQKAGIGAIVHDFKSAILVCRMAHERAHHHVALQWFDEGQTVALLPVNGGASSLVLTLPPAEIERLLHADRDAFNAEITRRVAGRLGGMHLVSTRHAYPLKAVYAHRFVGKRLALLGDAAVGMHPITAHGFNLGLREQETLAATLASGNGDPGSAATLARFEMRHRLATAPLFAATNGIATLYTHDGAPFMALRGAGLRIAERLSPFKSAVASMLMDRGSGYSRQG